MITHILLSSQLDLHLPTLGLFASLNGALIFVFLVVKDMFFKNTFPFHFHFLRLLQCNVSLR